MQTMTALLRVNGSRDMTVALYWVTPAEAWLLMHVHDASTKDVFEGAHLSEDVVRSKTEERARLQAKYPEQVKLIESLFPGRTASDVPEEFGELQDTPLELAERAQRAAKRARAEDGVQSATAEDGVAFAAAPVSKAQAKKAFAGTK